MGIEIPAKKLITLKSLEMTEHHSKTLLRNRYRLRVLILFFVLVLMPFMTLFSQELRYKDIKDTTRITNYNIVVTHPVYKPGIAGALNYLFMGLGHLYIDEPWRGACFLGAETVAAGFVMYGMLMSLMEPLDENYNYMSSRIIFFTGLATWGTIHVAGIYDTVRIARIKNYAYQQRYLSMRISPTIKILPSSSGTLTSLGVRLNVSF